ncbi:MAG: hydrogenase maturation nickel metallochaperone HypA [Isosphaeraceae bacterium]
MHELSIAENLVRIVVEALDAEGGGQVRVVRLRVGVLSGVVADALRFCYEIATAGTPLAGSRLEIETVPLEIFCSRCDRVSAVSGQVRLRCPICDEPAARIVGGREMEVESVELDDEPTAAPTEGETA